MVFGGERQNLTLARRTVKEVGERQDNNGGSFGGKSTGDTIYYSLYSPSYTANILFPSLNHPLFRRTCNPCKRSKIPTKGKATPLVPRDRAP